MALKNKDKLVNFNPDDFLNNFQKESIVSNPIEDKAKGENGDDEFYFCVFNYFLTCKFFYL